MAFALKKNKRISRSPAAELFAVFKAASAISLTTSSTLQCYRQYGASSTWGAQLSLSVQGFFREATIHAIPQIRVSDPTVVRTPRKDSPTLGTLSRAAETGAREIFDLAAAASSPCGRSRPLRIVEFRAPAPRGSRLFYKICSGYLTFAAELSYTNHNTHD
jgi:hypothetical protein